MYTGTRVHKNTYLCSVVTFNVTLWQADGFFSFFFLNQFAIPHILKLTDKYLCRISHFFQLGDAKRFEWQILITIIQFSIYSSVFRTTLMFLWFLSQAMILIASFVPYLYHSCYHIKNVHNCCWFFSKWEKSFKILTGLPIRYNTLTTKGKYYGKNNLNNRFSVLGLWEGLVWDAPWNTLLPLI